MKIALFTDTYTPQMNGVVAYISDVVKILGKDHKVVIFAPGTGHFRKEESGNISTYWIPSSEFPFYEGYRVASMNYKRISDLLKKERPDIVHAHAPINLGLQGLLAAKRRRIPTVVTYHTHFPDYVPHLLNGRLPGVFSEISDYTVKKLIKHVFDGVDVVTAPTHELVSELSSYGLRNVVYLPNGIDLKSIRCTPAEKKAFADSHGISRKKVAIYLGRISFEKRIEHLLEAFKFIEKKDRMLIIAGSGPYLKNFKDFARMMGVKNVVFSGFVKNKAAAYACADFFVSASDSETFGLTFIEAMSMGLPAVGIRRLGAKEVIRHGKTGLLVEPGSREALAHAMEKMFSDSKKRARMGAAAKKSAAGYSIEKSAGRTLEIYSSLLEK